MSKKAILIALVLTLTMPLFVRCAGNLLQRSELPVRMPLDTEMTFRENGGMLPTYKQIKISENLIFIKQRFSGERTPKLFYAEIPAAEKAELYRVFYVNKFDLIKNDKRDRIVYDAPSEGIYLRAGRITKSISYGANSPLSGVNLSRYNAVKNAIAKLEAKYKNQFRQVAENYAVIGYEAEFHQMIFENARPLELNDVEMAQISNLIGKAVDKYNSGQTDNRKISNLADYKFQYIPVYTENRQKQIWVNAFCNTFDTDWKKDLVFVKDGGNCYFNLKINLSNPAIYDFKVNGRA